MSIFQKVSWANEETAIFLQSPVLLYLDTWNVQRRYSNCVHLWRNDAQNGKRSIVLCLRFKKIHLNSIHSAFMECVWGLRRRWSARVCFTFISIENLTFFFCTFFLLHYICVYVICCWFWWCWRDWTKNKIIKCIHRFGKQTCAQ